MSIYRKAIGDSRTRKKRRYGKSTEWRTSIDRKGRGVTRKLKIITAALDEIKPYKNNPRSNAEAVKLVKNSIHNFDYLQPIVLDKNFEIIVGHTRYAALKELGVRETECILADHLTDKQVKAYRLADNKTSEFSTWDADKLLQELEDLIDENMTQYGFDYVPPEVPEVDLPPLIEGDEEDGEDEDGKDFHRESTVKQYNLDLFDFERTAGHFEIPVLEPVDIKPERLIGFNYMLTSEDHDAGIHFYVDDYQFERVWNRPDFYMDKMRAYRCVLTPDFSLYLDMPLAMKVWNVYRARLLGQYWQDNGLTVIPSISWAERETYDFCFDGVPRESTVAVSSKGVKRQKQSIDYWQRGMAEMIRCVQPRRILIHGSEMDFDAQGAEVIYFENEVTERWKAGGL